MTPGEYLVRVTHERFENLRCAGAAVELETNKGRVFKYHPKSSTKKAAELTTIRADPGHEIISLDIRGGVLLGFTQQPLSGILKAHAKTSTAKSWEEWFVVSHLERKADAIEHTTFASKAAAYAKMRQLEATPGQTAVLCHVISQAVVWKIGHTTDTKRCITAAAKLGYCNPSDKRKGLLGSLELIRRVLIASQTNNSRWRDCAVFLGVLLGMCLSQALQLQESLLYGNVMTLFNPTPSPHGVQRNGFVTTVCALNLTDCEAGTTPHVRTTHVDYAILYRENILEANSQPCVRL
jgi:hypothetical protein